MNSPVSKQQSSWRTPALVLLAGSLISLIGFGARSSLGLFVAPMGESGWSLSGLAFALAVQNLFWGLGLPIAGALADKYGARPVIIAGALVYGLGLYGMGIADSDSLMVLFAGVLAGTGIAFSAFSIAMAAMVKVVGPEKRSMTLGLGTAAGSAGQVLFSPLALYFIESLGWADALVALTLAVGFLIPLAFVLPKNSGSDGRVVVEQSIGEALSEALGHRGYVLLTIGFFVCGFHVAFITVHFPPYVDSLGISPQIGALSISLIGLFNIVGALSAGFIGQRFSKKRGLSTIYLLRSVAILCLLIAPKTETNLLVFASVMGLLWLSTVPLTTGIIAQVFGVRYMATLFGIVFLSHQIGSFIGIWMGGYLYETTGSYDGVWWAAVVLGVLSAIVHWPIDERPLDREAAAVAG